MKYAITITMGAKYFAENFKVCTLCVHTAIDSQGTEWTIISKNDKYVEVGQLPSTFVDGSREIH